MGITLIVYVLSCILCFFFVSFLIKLLKKVWWTPIRIESMLQSQGIRGPSYKFFHGNTKEIITMANNASKSSAELSHHLLFPTLLPHIYSWIKLYGKNFVVWHGTRAHFVITEPGLIKEMLNRKEGEFPKDKPNDYAKKLLGDGIATSNGDKWLKLRKLSNFAFHAESLKGMIPGMIASVEMMVERWKNDNMKEIEIFKEFKILTSEIISRTAFGSSYLEGQLIFDKLNQLASIIHKNKFSFSIPGIRNLVKTIDDTESEKLEKDIHGLFINLIKKREEEAISGQVDGFGSDFLGLLLKAYHGDDITKKLTVEEVVDECKTIYFAGHETVSSLLTWILFLLAIHPDWQDKARQEVLEIFGSSHPCPEELSRMHIVSMIINETLRLYSPLVFLRRDVEKEVRLGRLVVPADVVMEIPILAVHHNPDIWGEDVHTFKPERFAEGVAKATNKNVGAYIPFSLGPRNCVGSNFGITETKITLSMILQSFRFSLSPNYVHSPIPFFTMCPQHGLQIILYKL